MKNKINIIIIGAKNYNKNYNKNDYKTWNNPNQADYDILNNIKFKNKNCYIYNLDPTYISSFDINNISFINKYYELGDTEYLDINAHNIIIEFANILDEYFVTKISDNEKQSKNIIKYNEYKLSWISCGCCWDKSFPIELLNIIINNEFYSPTDPNLLDSFLLSIENSQKIIKNNIENIMMPFLIGTYQILGSVMWRGSADNYDSENILHILLNVLNISDLEIFNFTDDNKKQLVLFMNKKIYWNNLHRDIRLKINNYLYGNINI